MCSVRDATIGESAELHRLETDLKAINVKLWDIEDEIRGSRAGPRIQQEISLPAPAPSIKPTTGGLN